ncbi:hypothetical protein CI238_01693 [Colletotrichum incanum]|uniref:Uncharacterized protein n=1 Tax=Colletotrichum incanum TaxID=1573173 RepID=A0A162PH24_COLIC|nr:hypothetical protein CI238_01693 [Colletotrichum incanum]
MASPTSSPGPSSPSGPFGLPNGAPIPQKFTTIPKDQQALLEREDSWISSLKQNSRQGTVNVPPKALEAVKYFHTSRTLPPAAQKPNALVSSGPTETEPAAPTTPSHVPENADNLNSSPEIPISSWPESPQLSPRTARKNPTPSPAPSIKSQIVTERQSGASRFASQTPPPDHPSSPQIASSPPIQPAPKRHILPSAGVKRRPMEAFPSSSAGLEDELETAIPGALLEATPPINRVAAHLATASQAVTSPPCGQGSLVPSTYKDAKSPEEKAEGPSKRRRMKSIKFDSSPQGQPAESGHCDKTPARPTTPISASLHAPLPTSSTPPIASTLPNADAQLSLGTSRVAKDTPDLARAAVNGQQADTTSCTGSPAPRTSRVSKDQVMTGSNIVSGTRRARLHEGSFDQPTQSTRCQDIISYLDNEWNAENLDWLPPSLKHFRTALTTRSLETLQKITDMAVKNGTRLSRLWSEPDGLLHRATLQQTNGKLVFPEELVHMTLDLYGTEMSGMTSHPARATEETPMGSSRPTSRQEVATQARPANPSPPESPAVVQAPHEAPASPQVAKKHQRPVETPPQPPRANTKAFAQDPLEAFRNAYPSYSGSVGDFVKACLTIKDLRRKLLLPKWLYDDFIRAFVDGFIPYIETLDEDESPLPAYQWYVEYVDRPTFQGGIVTRENLHQVFKVYHSEFKSAKESLSGRTSPHPGVGQVPLLEKAEVQLEKGPQTRVTQAVEPRPEARPKSRYLKGTSTGLSLLPNQPSHVVAQETRKGPLSGWQAIIKVEDDDLLPLESYVPLTKGDKGKQQMPIKENTILRDAPASASATRRHRDVLARDEEVTLVSSGPRPRMANLDDAGSSNDNSRTHDGRNVSTIPNSQTATRNPLIPSRKDASAPKHRRDDVVGETPPRSSAAPAKTPTQHPAIRRSLPASFSSTPPSASMPSAETQRSGAPKGTLLASTQGNRVNKPRNETEEERKKRKMRAKLEKMAKEGRLALPPSSMPPKS